MKLKDYKKTELILAVNKQAFLDKCPVEGYQHCPDILHETLYGLRFFTIAAPRCYLEYEPLFLQYLPYIVFSKMVGEEKKYFTYQRTKKVGEERLAGNLSIGIGGHVELEDIKLDPDHKNVQVFNTLNTCAHREIAEEIAFQNDANNVQKQPRFQGFIVDNSNEVGQVHLGVVLEVFLQDSNIDAVCSEEELKTLGFMSLKEIVAYCEEHEVQAENWTKIYLKNQTDRVESGESIFEEPEADLQSSIFSTSDILNEKNPNLSPEDLEQLREMARQNAPATAHSEDIIDVQAKSETIDTDSDQS